MDTKKLRQKILDLAIHGKLVPQDPNDEPASVLLERIRAEKERLIAEGKIKKPKAKKTSDTPHYENEIPKGWVLTDIGELLTNRDSERIPLSLGVRSKQENKVYDYYGATGVVDKVDGFLFNERLLLIGEDGANLLSRSKDNAFFAEGKYWVNNHAHILDCSEKEVLDYVAFIINSMSLEKYITGSAQPKLNQDNLNKIETPLPPLEEQRRIIDQANKWFALIDTLETSQSDLEATIKQTKSKILDLAIHGKLVPQDPNDELASELLKRINPKAEITSDNRHYENIPKGWAVTQLDSICSLSEGQSLTGKVLPYLDVKGLRSNQYSSKTSGKFIEQGTMLILVDGENSGEVFQAPIEGYQGSTMKVLIISPLINRDYILYFIKFYQKALRENKVGSAIPHLNKKMFRELEIAIPPINEQKRIVAAIDLWLYNESCG